MSPEELERWYAEQIEKGFSKSEVNDMLNDLGIPGDQIKQVSSKFKSSSTPDVPPPTQNLPAMTKNVKYTVIGGVLLVLIIFVVIGIAGFFFFSTPPKPIVVLPVDGLPPSVSAGSGLNWQFYSGEVGLNCSDNGKEFSSGCNLSSFRFAKASEECPKLYQSYPFSSARSLKENDSFCVAVKDEEGNAAVNGPFELR